MQKQSAQANTIPLAEGAPEDAGASEEKSHGAVSRTEDSSFPTNRRTLYVIQRKEDPDSYYVRHGEIGGIKDAIGYLRKEYARRFLSREEAQFFIEQELPVWGRNCHIIRTLESHEVIMRGVPGAVLPFYADVVTAEMLNPAVGKLLIWRR